MTISSARDLVAVHEGLTLVAIPDTGGTWSLGYGRNHGQFKEGDTCTPEEAEEWLTEDLATATQGAMAALTLPYWDKLDVPRRAVLQDVAYEVGSAEIMKFTGTLTAIRAGDWHDAAAHLLASELAQQVPSREKMNATILLTGEFPNG